MTEQLDNIPEAGTNWIWVDWPTWRAFDTMLEFAAYYLDMGLDGLVIVTNPGNGDRWLSTVDPEELAQASKVCLELGLGVRWMTYPHSTEAAIDEHNADLLNLYTVGYQLGCPVWQIMPELDLEPGSQGWGSNVTPELAARLVNGITQIPWVTYIAANFANVVISDREPVPSVLEVLTCDAVVLATIQAYTAVLSWNEHNDAFRPGGSWLDICYEVQESLMDRNIVQVVSFGLAVFNQWHPAPYPQYAEACQVSYDHLRGLGILARRFCFWSAKQTWPSKASPPEWAGPCKAWISSICLGAESPPPGLEGVQNILKILGLYTGSIDGIWGQLSKSAHLTYAQERGGIPITEDPTFDSLLAFCEDYMDITSTGQQSLF